jgi:hypothetical protein
MTDECSPSCKCLETGVVTDNDGTRPGADIFMCQEVFPPCYGRGYVDAYWAPIEGGS